MTADEDRALLRQLLGAPDQLRSRSDAPDRIIRQGRRLVRRRRVLTASTVAAVTAAVAIVVGITGVFGTGRATTEPPPAAPPTTAPGGGLALGADQAHRFVLEDLARPATARILSLGPGTVGQVRAGGISANPGHGWVVSYTTGGPGTGQRATTRLAIVDLSGAMHPFGPALLSSTNVGLDVAPDGSRVALLLTAAAGPTPPRIRVMPLPGHAGTTRQWSVHDPDVNEIKDLSWAPDSRRLTYIAGVDTGAGIGGQSQHPGHQGAGRHDPHRLRPEHEERLPGPCRHLAGQHRPLWRDRRMPRSRRQARDPCRRDRPDHRPADPSRARPAGLRLQRERHRLQRGR